MRSLNHWLGIIVAVLVLGFAIIWLFVPEKKKEIQDLWYDMIVDCPQMQEQLANDQRCRARDDCELRRKESIRSIELEAQYNKYCSAL